MHKQTNQSLDNINFVQNITPENAAAYSGGKFEIEYIGGAFSPSREEFNPDIIFYNRPDANLNDVKGNGIMLRAATGEGTDDLAFFNDTLQSVELIRGDWLAWEDANFEGSAARIRTPGTFALPPSVRNKVSSIARVGS